jgi:hypothetical protein
LGLTRATETAARVGTSPVSTDAEAAFNCLHPVLALSARPVFRAVSNQQKRTRSLAWPGSPRLGEFPVDTSEGSTPVSNQTAAVLIVAFALLGFYLLVGYIVHKTGTTGGIADIGRAVADIIRAVAAVISAALKSRSP